MSAGVQYTKSTKNIAFWGWVCSSVLKQLSCMCKALGSIYSTAKKKNNKKPIEIITNF
jgi:hypothetical protein